MEGRRRDGNRRILVAPINWGLGHATRCIPIILELQKCGFEPVLGSDGAALQLLKKEFPGLQAVELPAYNISYAQKGKNLKWKLLLQMPHILRTVQKERKAAEALVKEFDLCGIISDNRFGMYSKDVPSVYITHQLKVLSGRSTFFSSFHHRQYIKRFDECWVPDAAGEDNLSGIIGHPKDSLPNLKYIGVLSRFQKRHFSKVLDYMILLSGPEPQRTLLEQVLLKNFRNTSQKVLFVRGIFSEVKLESDNPNLSIKNHLFGQELEEAINSSDVVIARSGYTTLMDLAKLGKKAFFIPTPGQPEQEYLAARLQKKGIAPFCKQDEFELSQLQRLEEYPGLQAPALSGSLAGLFSLFEGE
ncbi:MAG: glycosyltransferase [Salinimicrobium sp.]